MFTTFIGCTTYKKELMRLLLRSNLIVLLLTACNQSEKKNVVSKVEISNENIAFVPFNNFDIKLVTYLEKEIQSYFHKKVIVLPDRAINDAYNNMEKGKRFCADSIIKSLSASKNDTITTYVGLTNEDIYTTIKDEKGKVQLPIEKYKVWGIFGLGYCPGNACIISTKRLQTNDRAKFLHRVRTVVMHEIGHNYGLPHCPNIACIMSDANEKISTVDQSDAVMCGECSGKVK